MSQRVVQKMPGPFESRINYALDILISSIPLLSAICWFRNLVEEPVRYLTVMGPLILASTAMLASFENGVGRQGSLAVSTIFLVTVITPLTYALTVLMGAPFTTHIKQTLLLSFHLSIMAFFRAFNTLGIDFGKWLQLIPFVTTQNEMDTKEDSKVIADRTGFEGPVWGTLIGAYLGAIPIPLDWDRDWQKWPVTIYLGASAGLFLGTTITILYNELIMPSLDAQVCISRGTSRKARKLQ